MCDILRRRESIEARNSDARCNDNDYDDSDGDNELSSIGINSSFKDSEFDADLPPCLTYGLYNSQ